MSRLRSAVENAQYAEGITRFQRLECPTATERRDVGICLFHENRLLEAKRQLHSAINQGELSAYLTLAAVSIQENQFLLAREQLEQVKPEQLEAQYAAGWYRERARVGWMLAEPLESLRQYAEEGWKYAPTLATGFQIALAMLLGDLLTALGEPEAALEYLDFALQHGHTRRREYAQLCRSNAFVELGRFDEAEKALSEIPSPELQLLRQIKEAKLLLQRGDWEGGRQQLEALLFHCSGWPTQEVDVLLSLCLEHLHTDEATLPTYFERLQSLTECPLDLAALNQWRGFWLARQDKQAGIEQLWAAFEKFMTAGYVVKAIVVQLMLAEVQPGQEMVYLREAARLLPLYPRTPQLTAEWRLLPRLRQYLLDLPENALERQLLATGALSRHVTLRTLGTAELVMDGEVVKLGLARAEEILAYLLRKQKVALKDIQRDVLPAMSAERSKNYFHQMRNELSKRVQGLKIVYDATQKLYVLQRPDFFVWDIEILEQLLSERQWPAATDFTAFEFLPDSELEWVQEERIKLRRWLTEVGLETMETWYQAGEYQNCIQLAERLLPLDPLDESLHCFLLNATYRLKGHNAAALQYRKTAALFTLEVGKVPPPIRELQVNWLLN